MKGIETNLRLMTRMSTSAPLPFFFFGTLMDEDVRTLVLGRTLERSAIMAARLIGYERLRVHEESYPTLRPVPGVSVDGILVRSLSPEDERRLAYYEGAEYAVEVREVLRADGGKESVRLFLERGELATEEPWDFARWQRSDKAALLEAARRFMAGLETLGDRAEIDARWRHSWAQARQKR